MPDRSKLLAIYLNDHLAGATVGRELSRRTAGANEGTEFGPQLASLRTQIEEDRASLTAVMDRLGVGQDPLKRVGAIAGERLGRLKLNGSIREYSPLSRVVEFEALLAGIDAKRSLWNTLVELEHPQLGEFDFDALSARAAEQHAELSELKQRAALLALQ